MKIVAVGKKKLPPGGRARVINFVALLADANISRFTNWHYQIEKIRWSALEPVMQSFP
jgi:hypothetical protein